MADHGQQVDFEAKRIRFDPGFVEDKLAMVPRLRTSA
jgi:trimethylamine:corrinoid methyltransferase-like protein